MSTYNFQETIASRGCHVYKETTWSNAKVDKKVEIEIETNQSSVAIDPHGCAVKANKKYSDGKLLVTSREKFRGISTFSSKKKMEKLLVM